MYKERAKSEFVPRSYPSAMLETMDRAALRIWSTRALTFEIGPVSVNS